LCKPTNPVANVAAAVGEIYLDKGLPALAGMTLWRERTKLLKAAGSEYLNAQFGWLPLVKDITKFGEAVVHADDLLSQFERDSGKRVRRSFGLPTETTISTDVLSSNTPVFGPTQTYMSSGFGVLTRTREVKKDRWFKGCFTYHLPSGCGSRKKWQRNAVLAKHVFGIDLNPDVIWQLTPWSWAIDWVVNAGAVISNLNDFASYGLIMPYGYVMETVSVTDTYTLSGLELYRNKPYVAVLQITRVIKKRRKANPFGFGISWDGLSPSQLAITGALGLSRSSHGKR